MISRAQQSLPTANIRDTVGTRGVCYLCYLHHVPVIDSVKVSKYTVGTRGVKDIWANSIWRLSANTLGTWGVVSQLPTAEAVGLSVDSRSVDQ